MAIYRASTIPISRGKGRSAVASAAYRSGTKLTDIRYGKTHDYTKKTGVMSADILMPSSYQEQGCLIDRADLWNISEAAEKRKDARVGREWLLSLPHELDEITRKELAHSFSQSLADHYGVIADCAIHRPSDKEVARGADKRNFHAHIMVTTRKMAVDSDGQIILTNKVAIEWSDKKRKSEGMNRGRDEITYWRQRWEELANEKLAEHGHSLIDCRSNRERGLDVTPQIKLGKTDTSIERSDTQTARGNINRAIAKRNEKTARDNVKEHITMPDLASLSIPLTTEVSDILVLGRRLKAEGEERMRQQEIRQAQVKAKVDADAKAEAKRLADFQTKQQQAKRDAKYQAQKAADAKAKADADALAEKIAEADAKQQVIDEAKKLQAQKAANAKVLARAEAEVRAQRVADIEAKTALKEAAIQKADQVAKNLVTEKHLNQFTAGELINFKAVLDHGHMNRTERSVSFDKTLYESYLMEKSLNYKPRAGDELMLFTVYNGEDLNPNMKKNVTAKAIVSFMLKSTNRVNVKIINDYNLNLGVIDFVRKYGIEYDLLALKKLDEQTPSKISIKLQEPNLSPPQSVISEPMNNNNSRLPKGPEFSI